MIVVVVVVWKEREREFVLSYFSRENVLKVGEGKKKILSLNTLFVIIL